MLQVIILHIYSNSVYLKYAHVAKLPDLIGVQQLHSSCAFVEVVFEGDATSPLLDFTASGPEADVDGVGRVEDFAESGNVN